MSDREFERALNDWLESGSDRTPAQAIDAVLLAAKTTPQERDLRLPWRTPKMTTTLRLAAAIALLAIAGVAAFTIGGGPNDGLVPSPSPSAEASTEPSSTGPAALDTSGWISYTSERYGFDIKRPPLFEEIPSDGVWTMGADWTSLAPENFYSRPNGGVRVSAWSVGVASGTSLEAWFLSYCPTDGVPNCGSVFDRAVPVTLAGEAGLLVAGPLLDTKAFMLDADIVYIVSAWREDNDPSVAEFGGAIRLVEAFASTITLLPGGPAPVASPPALTESFTSSLFGYSIDFPGGWIAQPAAELLAQPDLERASTDHLVPPTGTGRFRALSAVVPEGADLEEWIGQFLTDPDVGGCSPDRATLADIAIDGQTGKVRFSCNQFEATVVVADRVYLFTLFIGDGEAVITAGGRALLEAMIATVQLTPETAEVAPSASP